jgi:hypothetical protein
LSVAPIAIAPVLRDTARLWRRHVWFLSGLAAIAWLPLAVIELAGVAHEVRIDTDHFDPVELLVGVLVVLVFELLITEMLAAASEKMVGDDLHGTGMPGLREFARTVPWGALLLGALVYEIGVMVGLVLFVVPGVLLFVWGIVSGPVIVAENCRAVRAPGRSRELVRGSFRPVLVLAVLGIVLLEVVAGTFDALVVALPHDWAIITGEYFVHVLTTPMLGMGTAVLYYALVERERARTRNEPAGAGSS